MSTNQQKLRISDLLSTLGHAPGINPLRKASARRAFLAHASHIRTASVYQTGKVKPVRFPTFLRLIGTLAVVLALSMGSFTGIVYASDRALPGDPLYPIDLQLEALQLKFSSNHRSSIQLLLGNADERILESEQLASLGDDGNITVALAAYSQTISELKLITENADQDVIALVNRTLLVQEERLSAIHNLVSEEAALSIEHAIESAHLGLDVVPTVGVVDSTPESMETVEATSTPPNQSPTETIATEEPVSASTTPTPLPSTPQSVPPGQSNKPDKPGKPENPGNGNH